MNRISLISLNLWNTEKLEMRRDCLKAFLETYKADIFCFQEIRPKLIELFKEPLGGYQRVAGPEEGWKCESSIYFRKDLFSLEDRGRLDLSMPEPERGVFWARLRDINGKELFVATMHLTHQLNADEVRTGLPYRHREATDAGRALLSLAGSIPAVICGDFNDPIHPSRIFHETAGFDDVWTLLGTPAPVTFPCPFLSDENYLVESIDKIMVKNGIHPIAAYSPRFSIPGQALSDHWPVLSVLEY
ncbi:MAG: endonuclease/exonuclease/phosphatase family protein [Sphaerochaeta sp.]